MKKTCFCMLAAVLLASMAKADTTMTYSGNLPGTSEDAVLFENVRLLAVTGISLDIRNYFGGKRRELTLSNIVADDAGVDGIYHYSNDGSTLEAHFEWNNTGYNFGLLLVLTQSGNDIRGRVAKVCYGGAYGTDLNNQSSGSCKYFMNEVDQDDYKSTGTFSTTCKNLTLTFAEIESHTVTFVDWDGTVLDTQTVAFGADATPPANPSRSGYVFAGWDTAFTAVTENLTVTAVYHQLFTVTFLDADGTVLSEQTVEETKSATAPDMTGRTYGGNPFSGWDADFSSVSIDLTVTAVYALVPDQVLAAVAAGNLPVGALIWGGDDGDTWDEASFNWYTTESLTTVWRAGAIAVFPTSGAVRVSGPKNAGGFIVALNSDVALSGDSVSLAAGAEAIFNSNGSLVHSNDVACADGFVQRVRDAHDIFVPGTTYAAEIDGNLTAESQLLFSNLSLADVEYIEGKMTGNFGGATKTLTLSTASAATSDGGAFHFANDGSVLTVQFQIKSYSSCRNCIKVRLEQVGNDIYGQIAYQKSAYTNGNNPPPAIGDNWDDYTVNGYSQSICDLKVGILDKTIYDVLPTDFRVEVAGDFAFTGTLNVSNGVFAVTDDGTLSGGNSTGGIVTWNDGTILFGSSATQTLVTDIQNKGTGEVRLLRGSTLSLKDSGKTLAWRFLVAGDASVTGYRTLPPDSDFTTVLPGGSLALDKFSSYWGPAGGGAPLVVHTNGLLRLINENSIGVSKPIYLEGGTLSNEVDKANVLYKLYMNDGAKVSGTGFQVGFKSYYNNWSFIDVGGSLPSLIDADSLMVGYQYPAENNKPIGVKFIVADVTGDAQTDLLVTSPITERQGVTLFNEGFRENLGVWKQGAGTLELAADSTSCATGVFKIEAGTVRFPGTASGDFGALVVLGDSEIEVARGARITFDASSDFVWTADKTLVFSGTMGRKSVRIGTSAAALTAEQLAAVKFRSASGRLRPMTIDGDGYLMAPSKGVVISVR
jgi:uncharacterized repeat protein (TIGR02543 family)